MTPTQQVVSRLDRVLTAGKNRYMACCPAHDDKSPSLSIAEAQDGKVLLRCFAGCSALDIVESIGLELSDLFPPDHESTTHYPPSIRDQKSRDTMDRWYVELCDQYREQGKRLTEAEKTKYIEAKARIRRGEDK